MSIVIRETLRRLKYAAAALALALPVAAAAAQERPVPREHHPWGRFRSGSWKLVRVATDSFGPQGEITTTSTTETRTELKELSGANVKLEISSTVEVAGKRVEAAPQTVVQGFHGEPTDQPVSIKDLGEDQVMVGGRAIPCRVQQLETTAGGTKTVAKNWYSDKVFPYVLRREGVATEVETGKVLSETKVEVLALDAQCTVLAKKRPAVKLEVLHKHDKGHTKTVVWTVMDVPGGIVQHDSDEFDAAQKRIRHSKLQLVDFRAN